jgi:hypothetical protein
MVMDSGVESLAIVGTAKNVGKTVTMNYLASRLSQEGMTIGLISSGRDGEMVDSLTGEPKPSVTPPEGAWVATAEGALEASGECLEIVDVSERPGLLGRLVLGRVVVSSPIELVGPQSAGELAAVVRKILALGADIVLVDGALDRLAAASPRVTHGAILATGASSQDNLTSIGQDIRRIAWLWSRPLPDCSDVRILAEQAISTGFVSFLDRKCFPSKGSHSDRASAYTLRQTPYRTCLGREDVILSQTNGATAVVVPGAITDTFLHGASVWAERNGFAVIVRDPTRVFMAHVPSADILVLEQINLLAATVNPVSYGSGSYDPSQIIKVVSEGIQRGSDKWVPVFDVVTGESNREEVAGVALG